MPRRFIPAPRTRFTGATYQLLLGHAPTAEDSLTILTIGSHINPSAFRDPVNGLVTPFETRAYRAGMLTSIGGPDLTRRQSADGSLPGDRSRAGLERKKRRVGARDLEVHAARVAYTNSNPHPAHVHPRSLRDADRHGRPMKERVRAWQEGLYAAVPAAPDLDAA